MAPAAAAFLIDTVVALKTVGMTTRQGCLLIGLPRATFYRITGKYQHYKPVQQPIPQKARHQPAALSTAERQVVLDTLTSQDYEQLSVGQAYWHVLDNDLLGCSQRTFYRVAGDHQLVGDRRRKKVKTGGGQPSRRKPMVHANKVGDLWSWDITDLKGPRPQDRYKLYLAIDVFSRHPTAWRIEHTESTGKVIQMFAQAFQVHGIPDCLHADNGASMRANALVESLEAAGVIPSYSRPRVSDDNPFSESLFRTIKYDLDMPDKFDNIEHARAWTAEFLHRYATEHRHSGIGHYTPASVHNGTAHQIQQQRQATLDRAYQQHPKRFSRRPLAPALPQPTGININLSQAG